MTLNSPWLDSHPAKGCRIRVSNNISFFVNYKKEDQVVYLPDYKEEYQRDSQREHARLWVVVKLQHEEILSVGDTVPERSL